jgi:hypothetical protein
MRKYNLHVRDDMWGYWQKEVPQKKIMENGLFRPCLVKLVKRTPREARVKVGDMVSIRGVTFRVSLRIGAFAVVVLNGSSAPGEEHPQSLQWSRELEDVREYEGEACLYKKCDPNDSRGPAYWAADGTTEPLTSS